jgi:hypothetical protein
VELLKGDSLSGDERAKLIAALGAPGEVAFIFGDFLVLWSSPPVFLCLCRSHGPRRWRRRFWHQW